MTNEELNDILQKYKNRLEKELDSDFTQSDQEQIQSKEYKEFRKELIPHHITFFERASNICGSILQVKVSEEKKEIYEEAIKIAHLNVTPKDLVALSLLVPFIVFILGVGLSILLGPSMFFAFFSFIASVSVYFFLYKTPFFMANNWRLKASNQMVLCVFYIVTYMRHTSNLELAINFASTHLTAPLSLDLKKVIWDVETEKYDTVKDSMDAYLETWRKHNMEFIESLHLVESSLFESNEQRRQDLLDKSLDVILQQTYDKMLRYAHDLKSPITTLHMLGIILPILGLVILPLLVSFMDNIRWYHLFVLYNVALPLAVFSIGKNILSSRPTGYGDSDISELNPELKKFKKINFTLLNREISVKPIVVSGFFALILFFIALSPLIIHLIAPNFDLTVGNFKLLGYRESVSRPGVILGPFGLGSSILSLAFPMSLAVFFGLNAKLKSKNIIDVRNKSKRLEAEFASALFQLGNRLNDGVPAESAFEKVSLVMQDTVSGKFFSLVVTNIRKLGMGIQNAIFDSRHGALRYFPSNIIDSSMRVLIESVRKGPKVAAVALLNVSRYIKEIHAVNERLKDLMAEIISDMKSQISFLSPAISGIVIGITSMITTIIGSLSTQFTQIQDANVAEKVSGIVDIFGDGIPTYYFQLVVGIYLVQLIYILTVLSNGIENGADSLGEKYALGNNLIRSSLIYCSVALVVILLFNTIAMQVLGKTLG